MTVAHSKAPIQADVVLAGGGLASGLIALRLRAQRPTLRVIVLERGAALGGEHTWCHFASDVSPQIDAWLAPLIEHRWAGYDVRFPKHVRTLTTPYRAVTSQRLHAVASAALGDDVWLNAEVAEIRPTHVRLADGRQVDAPLVIDGRGPRRSPHLVLAWQKFIGREVRLAAPHGLTRPTVMDASVDQLDGYRFLYVLPFGPNRLLIEDTRYSDGPELDRAAIETEIEAYAAERRWTIAAVERQEEGVLPIALAGDIDAYWRAAPADLPEVGLRSALFHPTTGYSLPDAARLADEIAAAPALTSAAIRALVEARSKTAWKSRGYYRLLNRMMFRACVPARRYKILQHFYRLPQPLVERFYAGDATLGDKARILTGKPPVPIGRAMAVMTERSAFPHGAAA